MIKKIREEFFCENSSLVCDKNGNYTKPSNLRKRFYRILEGAKIEKKGLHSLRHTFATNLVNGIKQPYGTIKSLTPRQVADLLGHSTFDITEMYYVKRNDDLLNGITNGFEILNSFIIDIRPPKTASSFCFSSTTIIYTRFIYHCNL